MFDLPLRVLKENLLGFFVPMFTGTHPNTITLISGIFGIVCACCCIFEYWNLALGMWWINRFLDGMDGVVARKFGLSSDFGGYLDILVDFFIYALIPIAIGVGEDRNVVWIAIAVMEGVFFVNAASLFQLAAILEKNKFGSKRNGELTSVTMPPSLIEGAETVIFFSAFIVFHRSAELLFLLFAFLVLITAIYRLVWASKRLNPKNRKSCW
jgi:phosphatidylglycerophosphate synthase